MTSSRAELLAAVSPSIALASSGPNRYSGVTLPDPEVLRTLEHVGARILTTFERDEQCADDAGPGGCDN